MLPLPLLWLEFAWQKPLTSRGLAPPLSCLLQEQGKVMLVLFMSTALAVQFW